LRERKMDCSIRKRKKVKDKNSDKKIVIVKLKILNKNGEKLRGIKKIRKKEKKNKSNYNNRKYDHFSNSSVLNSLTSNPGIEDYD
jgi:hypothetical protein